MNHLSSPLIISLVWFGSYAIEFSISHSLMANV
jgi:hypothetical protein